MTLEQEWKPRGLDGVERMARLVQQRAQVFIHAHGVHENERQLSEGKSLAVAARSFALAIVEVEQVVVVHRLVVAAKVGVDVGEDRPAALDESAYVVERFERGPAQGIGRHVPRTQCVEAHSPATWKRMQSSGV